MMEEAERVKLAKHAAQLETLEARHLKAKAHYHTELKEEEERQKKEKLRLKALKAEHTEILNLRADAYGARKRLLELVPVELRQDAERARYEANETKALLRDKRNDRQTHVTNVEFMTQNKMDRASIEREEASLVYVEGLCIEASQRLAKLETKADDLEARVEAAWKDACAIGG